MISYKTLLKSPSFQKYIRKMREVNHHYQPFGYINKYHLEGDIWSHTTMVIDYVRNCLKSNDNDLYLISLFHDIGKIYNYQINEKKRKIQFINHWFYSGNIFKDYFLRNSLIDREKNIPYLFNLYKVIQLHQINKFPQEIKDNLNKDLSFEYFSLLKNLCEADGKGRILDKEIKEIGYEKFFEKYLSFKPTEFNNDYQHIHFSKFENIFLEIENQIKNSRFKKIIILPIAPPASGKSTIAKTFTEKFGNKFYRIGYDDIRLEIFCEKEYGNKNKYTIETANTEIYQKAREYINRTKIDIHSILLDRINKKLKEENQTIIFVDNTNATFKSRRKILDFIQKRENVLKIALFIFNITFEEILKRNEKRNINIKKSSIKQIYNTIAFPSLQEFNEIFLI